MVRQASARICLVTTEILGVTRTGGIATVMTALADLLVADGHAVTVLCLNGPTAMDGSFDDWVRHYRRRGITLEPLARPAPNRMAGPWADPTIARRVAVLEWLAARAFDLVHVNDWGADAVLCARARRQGLALAGTRLVMGLHGASDWVLRANRGRLDALEHLIRIDLERMAPALMDAVWAPGRFMPAWLSAHGAAVPDVRVMPQLMPDAGPARAEAARTCPVVEPVLFGRLEDRKGPAVLLDALDRLAEDCARGRAVPPQRVTFLGRAGGLDGEPAERVIARRARAWPWPVRVLDRLDREDALAYLREPGRLALILAPMENAPLTLHECLALRIPVLASATGGIPDLIDPGDHARVLVPYDAAALAVRLSEVMGTVVDPARGRHDPVAAARRWRAWHRLLLAGDPTPPGLRSARRPGGLPCLRVVRGTEPRACADWKAALREEMGAGEMVAGGAGPVMLLTDADHLDDGALETLAAVLARTGADLLTPGWREGEGRVRLCLDGVPAVACVLNVVAGPGVVLGPRARALAARVWDPDSGLWGLVAVCVAAGVRHEAVPAALLSRPGPWRDPPSAWGLAPRLWAEIAGPQQAETLAVILAGLVDRTGSPGMGGVGADGAIVAGPGTASAWRRALRRDRRRARVLWRSWPWRWTRPGRNRARRRRGESPEPDAPPPLDGPGEASAVLFAVLVSRSWALASVLRLVAAAMGGCGLRRLRSCIRRWRVDSTGGG